MINRLFLLICTMVLLHCPESFSQDKKISIGDSLVLRSQILNEDRVLLISLPNGYNKSNEKYPVFYMLDGEANFIHGVGVLRFLAMTNNMPPVIIVGIVNTKRNRDLAPPSTVKNDYERLPGAGGAEKFLSFLNEELKPYINKNYRTQPFNILFGHSLGGLFSIHTLLNKSESFNAYIAASPALWYNDNEETKTAEKINLSGKELKKAIYIANGNEMEIMKNTFDYFVKAMNKNRDIKFKSEILPEENHQSSCHLVIYNALKFFYKSWKFDFDYLFDENNSERNKFTADMIINHYRNLSNEFGYICRPAEGFLNNIGYALLRRNFFITAIEVFRTNVGLYPESANVYDSLGEAYMNTGNKAQAIENYEKSLKLNPNNKNAVENLKKLYEK